jgi:hypothetical protein
MDRNHEDAEYQVSPDDHANGGGETGGSADRTERAADPGGASPPLVCVLDASTGRYKQGRLSGDGEDGKVMVRRGNGEPIPFDKSDVFDDIFVSLDGRFVLVNSGGVAHAEPLGENFVLCKGEDGSRRLEPKPKPVPVPDPDPNKRIDDPHVLARTWLFRHTHATDGFTIAYWMGMWYTWNGSHYVEVPIDEIHASISRMCESEFERINYILNPRPLAVRPEELRAIRRAFLRGTAGSPLLRRKPSRERTAEPVSQSEKPVLSAQESQESL